MVQKRYRTLQEFYPFYLTEHQNTTSRVLHFIGSALAILCFLTGIFFHSYYFLIAIPFLGYGFAWVGHFFFEKNKPATFQYPIYSLVSDFILFWEILNGKQSFKAK
jgi:hypothetical protein